MARAPLPLRAPWPCRCSQMIYSVIRIRWPWSLFTLYVVLCCAILLFAQLALLDEDTREGIFAALPHAKVKFDAFVAKQAKWESGKRSYAGLCSVHGVGCGG